MRPHPVHVLGLVQTALVQALFGLETQRARRTTAVYKYRTPLQLHWRIGLCLVFDMVICFSRYHGVNLVQLMPGAKLHDGSFSRFRFGLVPVRKENPRRNNKKTERPPLTTRRLNAIQQIRSDKSSIKQPSKERAKRASEISAKRF